MRSPRLLVALALVATVTTVPALLAAPAAEAATGCQDETHVVVLGVATGCDDITPPDTAVAASPTPVDGLVPGNQVKLTLTGSYGTTGDTGALGFECDFYALAAGDPKTWTPCASGVTYASLTTGVSYVVRIRAVDLSDAAIAACASLCALPYTEIPDYDATPVSLIVIPTGGNGGGAGGGGGGGGGSGGANAPQTVISRGISDKLTPANPVALSSKVKLRIASSQAGRFNCAVNAHPVRCANGVAVLKRLSPGPQVFVAQAVTPQNFFDPSPATLDFFVPTNLQAHGSWRGRHGHGYFRGDVLTTHARGATLTVGRYRHVREVRLIAPSGPTLGVVAVRVGHGSWTKVDLHGRSAQPLHSYEVLRPGSHRASGVVQIRAVSGSVAVDAIVVR